GPLRRERDEAVAMLERASDESGVDLSELIAELRAAADPNRRLIHSVVFRGLVLLRDGEPRARLAEYVRRSRAENEARYASHLLSDSADSPLRVSVVAPGYVEPAESVDGRSVLQRCFDANLARDPCLVNLCEDVRI